MINKKYIQRNLIELDKHFQKHRSIKDDFYYSKLALLETCGWIEDSMDCIIRDCLNRHLKSDQNIQFIEDMIENTHSFQYSNFRKMLVNLLGIINVEKLEILVDNTVFIPMQGSLGLLKSHRDPHAHSYVKGTLPYIKSPSWTKQQFIHVYKGLKNIEYSIRQLKLF
jgi:hypothetical protein